jgi:hypothetical protein
MKWDNLKPGDTFLVNLGEETHLYVVLSHPFDNSKNKNFTRDLR